MAQSPGLAPNPSRVGADACLSVGSAPVHHRLAWGGWWQPCCGSAALLMAGIPGAWMWAAALCTFPAVSLATKSSCQQPAMSGIKQDDTAAPQQKKTKPQKPHHNLPPPPHHPKLWAPSSQLPPCVLAGCPGMPLCREEHKALYFKDCQSVQADAEVLGNWKMAPA